MGTKKPTTKSPSAPPTYSWSIYRVKGTPAAFVGIVDAATAEDAIKMAIEEFKVTGDASKLLIAQRR